MRPRPKRLKPPEGSAAVMADDDIWMLICQILAQDGSAAGDFVADQISEALTTGDRERVENWRAVASQLNEFLQLEGRMN